jgi:N-acetyl-anhydromuramyl-L-alanine amidase AmpD
MKASSIPAYEKKFLDTGMDSLGKKFILKRANVPVPGGGTLSVVDCKRENNDESFYFKEKFPKERVVLHFTAGYLRGDIATLTTPQNHVSVAYVVARSGDVFRLWDDAYWSYHLGVGSTGGNTEMSKRSVGIEISNIGWLKKIGTNLASSYSDSDIYCTAAETVYYTSLPAPFREQKLFATFTAKQYDSTISLLKILGAKYPAIGKNFLPNDKRFVTLQKPGDFKGILSHVNFRKSGKWDLGPAFDWSGVTSGV